MNSRCTAGAALAVLGSAGFMAINLPTVLPPQNPLPAALAAAAEAAATNMAIMQALRPLPRVRGLSLWWVPGSGGAPGVY